MSRCSKQIDNWKLLPPKHHFDHCGCVRECQIILLAKLVYQIPSKWMNIISKRGPNAVRPITISHFMLLIVCLITYCLFMYKMAVTNTDRQPHGYNGNDCIFHLVCILELCYRIYSWQIAVPESSAFMIPNPNTCLNNISYRPPLAHSLPFPTAELIPSDMPI